MSQTSNGQSLPASAYVNSPNPAATYASPPVANTICERISRLENRLQSIEEQFGAALQMLDKRASEVELRLG